MYKRKENLITLFLAVLFHLFLILGVTYNTYLFIVAFVLGVIVALNISKREPEEIDNILTLYAYFIIFMILAFAVTGFPSGV
ncbi:MAG: hypothetical protein E6704_07005 [Anaerococcus prevotii]|nr:hypothetical protein [Anaerococcus prevotii]